MIRLTIALLLVICASLGAVIGLWAADRTIPVRRTARVVVMGDAHPGGKLLLRWKVTRDRSCASTKQEVIVESNTGVRWPLPQQLRLLAAPGPVGVRDVFVTQTELPEEIEPGPALLRVVLTYECNPIHKLVPITDIVPDVPFLISPGG
jgi:hypothetical protein